MRTPRDPDPYYYHDTPAFERALGMATIALLIFCAVLAVAVVVLAYQVAGDVLGFLVSLFVYAAAGLPD